MGICLASGTGPTGDRFARCIANGPRITGRGSNGVGMTVGRIHAPEWRESKDPLTGRRVRQLTNSTAEDYHLYFYNPSITPDGKYLIFISERTGISNLFRMDLRSGSIVQLTDAQPVRAEYWPFTEPVKGVGSCLPALGNGGQEVFYFVGPALFAVEVESLKQRELLSLSCDRR